MCFVVNKLNVESVTMNNQIQLTDQLPQFYDKLMATSSGKQKLLKRRQQQLPKHQCISKKRL